MAMLDVPWAAWTIVVPLLGSAFALLVRGRRAHLIGVVSASLCAAIAGFALVRLWHVGAERHALGGWQAPLGIELVIDGWGLGFITVTAALTLAVSVYSWHSGDDEDLRARFFGLLLMLQGGLNALFLSGDLFNLYVTLEVVALSAAGLTALERSAGAVRAALHYFLLSLAGSFCFLAGVVLIYLEQGTLDLALLAERSADSRLAAPTVALLTGGLILKAGLFPLHTWLPPAHASASAPVSALLSGIVVKGPVFVLFRIALATWPALWAGSLSWLLGALGAAAIFWGYGQALRSNRLKTIVAYSTVAQTGQLFLVFPLVAAGSQIAIGGFFLLAASHALGKAAAFLPVGNVVKATGGDRLEDFVLCRLRTRLTQASLAIASLSLIGLPPSAGFLGKWLLLEASIRVGQWVWSVVLVLGTLLSASVLFRILHRTLTQEPSETAVSPLPSEPPKQTKALPANQDPRQALPKTCEWVPFGLALTAAVLGALGEPILGLVQLVTGPASHLVGAP